MSPAKVISAWIQRRVRPMTVPLIVGCALLMQMLDATVITTALPAMADDLGESPVRMNIAMTAYLLSAAVFVPICGWAADRFGARRVFVLAIMLFTLSSVWCGLAQSLEQIIAGRFVQGFAGAMMVPVGRIVLLRTVPKSELVRAISFLSLPALFGPILGPALGGLLVTYTTWRWIFFMNVPIGILGVYLVFRFIEKDGGGEPAPLDFVGFVLTGICMATLVFGFDLISHADVEWPWIGGLLGLGLGSALLYYLHAQRREKPILDFSLFKIQTFRTSIIGGNLCRLAIGAVPFLLAMQLQVAFGLSAVAAGMLTFSGAVGALVMKFTAPHIYNSFGFRRALVWNAWLLGFSIVANCLFTAQTPHAVIVVVLLVSGFFRSLQLTAVNSLTYADIKPEQMGSASGMASAAQQLAISMGVAVAAFSLKMSMTLRGVDKLEAIDVVPGYLLIALSSLISGWAFSRMSADAGKALLKKEKKA